MNVATMTTGSGAAPNHYRLTPAGSAPGLPAQGDSGAGVMYRGVTCGIVENGNSLENYADATSTDAIASWITLKTQVSARGDQCGGRNTRNKVLRLMGLGDSITYGIGSSTGNGYRAGLQSALETSMGRVDMVGSVRSGSMADDENEGHPGYTIDQLIGVAKTEVAQYKPNVVTLHVGTNDMNDDDDPDGAPARLHELLDTIYAADPDVTVVLASLIPSRLSTTEARIQQFNASLPQLVDDFNAESRTGRRLIFADMDAVNTGDLTDDLHPDDVGYAKMAGVFDEAVEDAVTYGYVADRPGQGSSGTPGPDPSVGRWSDQGVIAGGVGADPNSTYTKFADIDGDGRADYLVVNKVGAVDAWRNEGALSSTAGRTSAVKRSTPPGMSRATATKWGWFHVGTIATGIGSPGSEIQFADLNGDGRADYLAVHSDGSVNMYLNGGYQGGKWDWIDYGRIAGGIGEPGADIQFADVTGDGRADYVYVNPQMGAMHMYVNGGGTPGHWDWVDRGVIATGTFANADHTVQLADINNDGFADYLYISKKNGSVDAYTNHGEVSGKWDWVPQGQVQPGAGAASLDNRVYESDLDGDGRADYVSVDQFGAAHAWLDEGLDTTAVAGWLPLGKVAGGIGVPGKDVQFKDLNGDGRDDYLAVHGDGSVTAYLNGGSKPGGGWDWIDEGTISDGFGAGGADKLILFGDLNGDGKADYFSVDDKTGEATAWINDGGTPGHWNWTSVGQVSGSPQGGSDPSQSGGALGFADLNGDGYDDYGHLSRDTGALTLNPNTWASDHSIQQAHQLIAKGVGVPSSRVRIADFDGDGRPDYLALGQNGSIDLWLNAANNGSTYTWINSGQVATGIAPYQEVKMADLNGDHRADYLVVGKNSGSVTAYLNNGGDN